MRNKKHAAVQPVSNILNQAVKRYLAIEVNALYGLVENKKIGRSQNCAREQDTLELATGQVAHLRICQMKNLGGGQCVPHLTFAGPVG